MSATRRQANRFTSETAYASWGSTDALKSLKRSPGPRTPRAEVHHGLRQVVDDLHGGKRFHDVPLP